MLLFLSTIYYYILCCLSVIFFLCGFCDGADSPSPWEKELCMYSKPIGQQYSGISQYFVCPLPTRSSPKTSIHAWGAIKFAAAVYGAKPPFPTCCPKLSRNRSASSLHGTAPHRCDKNKISLCTAPRSRSSEPRSKRRSTLFPSPRAPLSGASVSRSPATAATQVTAAVNACTFPLSKLQQ